MESADLKAQLDFLVYLELKDPLANKDPLDLVDLLDYLVSPDLL